MTRPAPLRTLLLVDDEPNILESTRFILVSEGFRVLVASDGEEALAVMRREHPPVVLLDVMMPKLDGYDVCRRIRAEPSLAGTYVIMLTARGQPGDVQAAVAAGADAHFRKPFDDDTMMRELAKAFGRPGAGGLVPSLG